jgi:hypothetical protein
LTLLLLLMGDAVGDNAAAAAALPLFLQAFAPLICGCDSSGIFG